MASAYFRSMATCSMLKRQLEKEINSRQAMELCFKNIHKSLDLYKGHFINRIRFHMNRHHTEYLRKVRAQAAKSKVTVQIKKEPIRRSERVSQLEELTVELERVKKELADRSKQMEELCHMLEIAEKHQDHCVDTEIPPAKHGKGTQTAGSWDGVLVGP